MEDHCLSFRGIEGGYTQFGILRRREEYLLLGTSGLATAVTAELVRFLVGTDLFGRGRSFVVDVCRDKERKMSTCVNTEGGQM